MAPRILYIAGYSRSGSTLLDMLLNQSPSVASGGELTYLLDDAKSPRRTCTCGATYGACARYGTWVVSRPEGEAALVRQVEQRAHFHTLLHGKVTSQDTRAYGDYADSLFSHIQNMTGAEVVVDSSKSARDAAGRPLALSRLAGLDVRILHLTRDPRQTIRSYIDRGSNWVLEGHRSRAALETWRPILGWTLANRIARNVGQALGPDRYLHLKFEDVLADPTAALHRIAHFADVDLSDAIQAISADRPLIADHMVGGNRTRLQPQRINPSATTNTALPRAHEWALMLIGQQMARELGYA